MGSIEPYETAAGRRYKVQFRKPDRSTTTKRGFTTKRAAQLFLAQAELHIAGGTWIDGQASRVKVDELGPPWLAAKAHLKPSSFHVLAAAWRIHVEPVWGARTVGSITPSEIQDWVADLTRRRSATVVIRAYGVLAGVLERAVNDRQIALTPARNIALPRKGRKHRSYLTHAQVEALSVEAREHGTLVLLLAYTGLRWGEAVALRVESVDFARERLLVRANAVNVAGRIIPGTPKSHDSRSVAFPHFLAALLQVECRGKLPGELVFGAGFDYLPTPTHKDGWFAGARKRACLRGPDLPAEADDPRPPAHGREPRDLGRRERESRPADARPRLRRDDPRHLRRPFRGRLGRRCERPRSGENVLSCSQNAVTGGCLEPRRSPRSPETRGRTG